MRVNIILCAMSSKARSAKSHPSLRERKRLRTKRAIQDAAFALFAQQGYEDTTVEQVADLAEVATATFFRYFPGKADVVLDCHDELLPALWEAIVSRPLSETDFVAVKNAIKQVWLIEFDVNHTARLAKIITLSPTLRRLSADIGRGWLIGVSRALAIRRGNDQPPEAFSLRARVALAVFSHSVAVWIEGECNSELEAVIDEQYDKLLSILEEL
jgi:AcrR family transcriptional regulator